MKAITELLAENPFFKVFDANKIEILAECGKKTSFKKGDVIFREGEEAKEFYLVLKGKVSLEIDGASRGNIAIHTVEDGEILGWSWLIPPHEWAFTASVKEDVEAIALDGLCIRSKCEGDHALGYLLLTQFSTVLAKRLESARVQLLDVYGSHVEK